MKRKLTKEEKAVKKFRQQEYMTVFMQGKMKRVKRSKRIDGISEDEFIRRNADPSWLLQNGMYEELYEWEELNNQQEFDDQSENPTEDLSPRNSCEDELPF